MTADTSTSATIKLAGIPTDAELESALTGILAGRVTVLQRRLLDEGTFPGERVIIRVGRRRSQSIFCKYSANRDNVAHGHRGGPEYEISVYEHLLSRSSLTLVPYRGCHRSRSGAWLILDFLENCHRIHLTENPASAMRKAAQWIGQFHAEQERKAARPPAFVNRYDAAWYAGWARRTCEFAGPLHRQFPWLRSLCAYFESVVAEMTAEPQTLIHGEFYPKNVLLYRGAIYPVDWESAAVGFGEIDLASLTEGWPRKVGEDCHEAYLRARWPKKQPQDAERRLWLARLYLHLRWLGDRPDWTQKKSSLWHFRQLRVAGKKLGFALRDRGRVLA